MIYGITLDDVSKTKDITDMLSLLPKKIAVRIVFDENVKASYYKTPVSQIHDKALVMGELLDSEYVKPISVADYQKRTVDYLATLGNAVDIWEVGNEVNGEWLGKAADVVSKINAATSIIKAAGKKTALTLYYNAGCYDKKSNEMFTWVAANITEDMKKNFDYVLISYYECDCENLKPDWQVVFTKLNKLFPNSLIGFGECGAKQKDTTAVKASYLQRYYNMKINVPNFIGGFFYWYGHQDLVPSSKPLFTTFSNLLKSLP